MGGSVSWSIASTSSSTRSATRVASTRLDDEPTLTSSLPEQVFFIAFDPGRGKAAANPREYLGYGLATLVGIVGSSRHCR